MFRRRADVGLMVVSVLRKAAEPQSRLGGTVKALRELAENKKPSAGTPHLMAADAISQ